MKLNNAYQNPSGVVPFNPANRRNSEGVARMSRLAICKDLPDSYQTRCKNRIKSFLYFLGIEFPEEFTQSGTHWSKRFINWLKQLDLGEHSGNVTLRTFLEEAEFFKKIIIKYYKRNKGILPLPIQTGLLRGDFNPGFSLRKSCFHFRAKTLFFN